MKNTESWANDILHWHDDMAANPTAFIGVRDAHRDAAALVRRLQAELQGAHRAGLELLEALKMARDELAGLPHSLGYAFTHLPKINAAIGRAQGRGEDRLVSELELLEALKRARAEAQGSGEVEYEFEVWQNGSLQANGSTFDYPAAKSEADHYAAMYGQDGPVEVRLFMKRQITAPPSVPVEGEEILVNAAHDVYTLPLHPSGLSSGPRFVVHVPGPEQPAAVDDEPVAWPLASPEEADKGWTLDYRFIEQVERIASQRTDYTTSMEATEQVLIAANEVLRVSRPAAQQPAAVDGACAIAAIQFALNDPEGMTFLRLWNEGEFDTLRREWPDAPNEVYVGADPSPPSPEAPTMTAAKDAEIEALRSRLEDLVRNDLNEQCRAWRLAEALREATDLLLSDYPEEAKRLHAALHSHRLENIKDEV